MINQITDEMIEYVEILAQLGLSEEEKIKAKQDMNQMISYVDRLDELDTNSVEPMVHNFPIMNVFREDRIENGNQKDAIMANAPKKKNGAFQVPKTID